MNTLRIAAMAGLASCAISAQAAWYTNEVAFLAAVGTSYTENFNGATFGSISGFSWNAPGANGYGWTASSPQGLYSNVGAMSINNATNRLTLTFTGAPVYAFGGLISDTNVSGGKVAGTSHIQLSSGETMSLTQSTAVEGFLGWVGTSAFTSVDLWSSGGDASPDWINLDHAIVGNQAVPEPASMIALGLGGLALFRKRRRSA